MTEENHDSSSEEASRNTLNVEWKSLEQKPNNNAERAYRGWRILQEHIDLLAVRGTGTLYACHGGVWEDDGEQVLREHARQMMLSDYRTTALRELKDQVRATNSVPRSELGVPDGAVAVNNGLLNLETRELRELHPEDRALHRLPVAHDPGAECPRWRSFLEDVTEDEAAHRQLQEFVGYCLAGGEPWLKKALMIFGPTDAGKTVFLEVIEALFGEDANAAQTPQYLADQRWGIHELAGKPGSRTSAS
jgi:putative DNA primase/helicase